MLIFLFNPFLILLLNRFVLAHELCHSALEFLILRLEVALHFLFVHIVGQLVMALLCFQARCVAEGS